MGCHFKNGRVQEKTTSSLHIEAEETKRYKYQDIL